MMRWSGVDEEGPGDGGTLSFTLPPINDPGVFPGQPQNPRHAARMTAPPTLPSDPSSARTEQRQATEGKQEDPET